jgi:hypothetical protein
LPGYRVPAVLPGPGPMHPVARSHCNGQRVGVLLNLPKQSLPRSGHTVFLQKDIWGPSSPRSDGLSRPLIPVTVLPAGDGPGLTRCPGSLSNPNRQLKVCRSSYIPLEILDGPVKRYFRSPWSQRSHADSDRLSQDLDVKVKGQSAPGATEASPGLAVQGSRSCGSAWTENLSGTFWQAA